MSFNYNAWGIFSNIWFFNFLKELHDISRILFNLRWDYLYLIIIHQWCFNDLTIRHYFWLCFFEIVRLDLFRISGRPCGSASLWITSPTCFALFNFLMLPLSYYPLSSRLFLSQTWKSLKLFIKFRNFLQTVISCVVLAHFKEAVELLNLFCDY